MKALNPLEAKIYSHLVDVLQEDVRGHFDIRKLSKELHMEMDELDQQLQNLEDHRFIQTILLPNQPFIIIELNS